jgi:hypothetical protein
VLLTHILKPAVARTMIRYIIFYFKNTTKLGIERVY